MDERSRSQRVLHTVGVVVLALALVAVIGAVAIAVAYHFWVVHDPQDIQAKRPDDFLILPREDHNVHALEAFGTLAVAIVSVMIAYLIWRTFRAELKVVESHKELVGETCRLVDSNIKAVQTSAIQTIAVEMLRIDRWMADHPDYLKALALPEQQESATGSAVAEVYADFIDTVISEEDLLPQEHLHAWIDYFRDIHNMWPQLRKYMKAHPDWYLEDQNRLTENNDPEGEKGQAAAPTG